MDGNRRYARQLGQPVLMGHAKGAQTAANILEWWLRFIPNTASNAHPGPQYMTVWAFSAENFKRSEHELEGLFRLMTAEFRSLAFTSIVHLFRIRIRIIGNRTGLPFELLETIEMLEEITSSYDKLFLQIAVGYGGRDEIVQSVKRVLEKGDEVTEKNISAETFCSRVAIPPVELIVRTSERRTSGFFLWDTQGAELHFINKLWPELNEGDWLDAIASFAKREMRWGM
ncbi:Decaprenyl diphosphate synthase-like protein [Mycena floridula]|nr:Decaprenyl diphosphate synthase-like protein [Mycena floridula]